MLQITQQEDEIKWLDPGLNDPAKLLQLLVSYLSSMMEIYYVSTMINSIKNEWKPAAGATPIVWCWLATAVMFR
jgi:putative SOS response-associated peptidase YedK